MLRWLFSLAASCYIIAAIVLLPIGLTGLRLALWAWWAVYLPAEALALGVPIGAALWWFLGRRADREKPVLASRLAGLIATALVPLFAFFVVPIGCWVSLPDPGGSIAGWSVFCASALALLAYWAYARYVWRPRNPEVAERFRRERERR